MSEEEWRHVPGFPPFIEASSLGNVRGSRGTKRLYTQTFNGRYYTVTIWRNQYRVNRLVCAAFHGIAPEGMHAAHINGVNKDNTPENLYWATPAENVRDTVRQGKFKRGNHPRAAFRERDIQDIRQRRASGETMTSIHRSYPHVCYATISHICNNRNWKQ